MRNINFMEEKFSEKKDSSSDFKDANHKLEYESLINKLNNIKKNLIYLENKFFN